MVKEYRREDKVPKDVEILMEMAVECGTKQDYVFDIDLCMLHRALQRRKMHGRVCGFPEND